jgi:hypothetical protein
MLEIVEMDKEVTLLTQMNATDRSTQIALHMPPLEDNATALVNK